MVRKCAFPEGRGATLLPGFGHDGDHDVSLAKTMQTRRDHDCSGG